MDRDPRPGTQEAEPETRDPGPRNQGLESRIEKLGPRTSTQDLRLMIGNLDISCTNDLSHEEKFNAN